MRGLTESLDRRLRKHVAAPLAVAYSGGGDSLALLLAAKDWADANGRSLLALTVDHGLNADSAAWTARCRDTAARLGIAFRALCWTGEKPATGLPAAARAARHALLAAAAREAGARVVLMGHTADDLAEAAAMRAEGSTVSDPSEWSPSPAWPEGRDVFLLRPMLGLGRAEIREWLRARGETWIDDPANEDQRFARARVRASLSSPAGRWGPSEGWWSGLPSGAPEVSGSAVVQDPLTPRTDPSPTRSAWSPSPCGGGLKLAASAPARLVAIACLCAAGTSRPPRGDRLARLVERLQAGEAFTTTLAGARIMSDGVGVHFFREAGRSGLPGIPLIPGRQTVWDGRFEFFTEEPGLVVLPLVGQARRLPEAEHRRLASVPAIARPTLPVILRRIGEPSCPILAETPSVRVRALALPRFEAAVGVVDSEPAV